MNAYQTELNEGPVEGEWFLRVRTPDGLTAEYRCRSFERARFMAAVFALGPTTLPPPDRVFFPGRERARVKKKRQQLANVTAAEFDSVLDALAG